MAINDNKELSENGMEWKHFLRQLFVASSVWAIYFSMGIVFGSPTVCIQQLRKTANTTGVLTDEMASWISSTFSYASIPWIFVLPYLCRVIGRRKSAIIMTLCTIVGFGMFTLSSTPTHILITEAILGVTQAGCMTITLIIISEYTSPKYRGVFLCIKSATTFWGIWVANAIGAFTHWWYIALVGLITSSFALTMFFWPESPHWLASKKRFAECRQAHRWLKGHNEISELELDCLIQSQSHCTESYNFKAITLKACYMPLLLCLLVVCQYHFSGKLVITIYAIDILKKMMSDETKVYETMLIIDGVSVFSTYVGSYITKVYARRSILFVTSGTGIFFLFALSIYMYLVKCAVIVENLYVSIFFLCGFSLAICCGPMILSTSLYGELIPTQFKSLTVSLTALTSILINGTLLKLAPMIFKALSMSGTFLFYAIGSCLCFLILFLYLPETKDKTLLEIEDYFKDSRSTSTEESKKFIGTP